MAVVFVQLVLSSIKSINKNDVLNNYITTKVSNYALLPILLSIKGKYFRIKSHLIHFILLSPC